MTLTDRYLTLADADRMLHHYKMVTDVTLVGGFNVMNQHCCNHMNPLQPLFFLNGLLSFLLLRSLHILQCYISIAGLLSQSHFPRYIENHVHSDNFLLHIFFPKTIKAA